MEESGRPNQSARASRVDAVKNAAPFRAADVAVYAALLVLIGILLWVVFANRRALSDSTEFEVYVDNRLVMTLPADTDASYPVKRGETVLLVLDVRARRASVRGSVCGDHLCERMTISDTAGQIVCLPNGVSIHVKLLGMGDPTVPVG